MKLSDIRILLTCLIILSFYQSGAVDNESSEGKSNGQYGTIKFADHFFEHASPVLWTMQGDTIVKFFILPDYERESLNRQATHWYFKLDAEKGKTTRFILAKMMADVYNGRLSSGWWTFEKGIPCYISYDNKNWEAVRTKQLPGNELLVEFPMEAESVYIARMPPYTLSDLEDFKSKIEKNRLVKIFTIGETVEKRPLEIIQIGNPEAQKSILIRARSHPWESGGNWLIEGLINRFISENSEEWKEAFCIYIMPMANKDGVVRGMTRFNLNGMDLNRNWDSKSDPDLCPEKFVFEEFIEKLIAGGSKPCLAIDIHNDDSGGFHLSRYVKEVPALAENMTLLEKLMREKTTYAEDVKYSSDRVVTLSCGMYQRYGIEAIIYEINANWMKNPGKVPTAKDWMEIGENMNEVFYEYTLKMN